MSGRIPGNEWVENPNRGTAAYVRAEAGVIYKPMLTYHQTVGMDLSKSYVANHPVPPHNWINPYRKTKWQTQELDLAAKALYQQQFGDHWSNKHYFNIQCEIVGVPVVNQETYTDDQLRWIAEEDTVPKVLWLRENGMDIDLTQVHYVTNSSGSASEYWPGRCSEHEMATFNGITQHIKWPYNDHWDCSVERLDKIAQYAREILGESEGEVDLLPDERAWLEAIYNTMGSVNHNTHYTHLMVDDILHLDPERHGPAEWYLRLLFGMNDTLAKTFELLKQTTAQLSEVDVNVEVIKNRITGLEVDHDAIKAAIDALPEPPPLEAA